MNPSLRPLFKIDEDLPIEVAGIFAAAGGDAATVMDQQMLGWVDDRLWPVVVAEGRSLVTSDVGFADARRLRGTTGIGIVLFRLWPESRRGYIELAQRFVNTFPLCDIPGRIITVTPTTIRVHDTRNPDHKEP